MFKTCREFSCEEDNIYFSVYIYVFVANFMEKNFLKEKSSLPG